MSAVLYKGVCNTCIHGSINLLPHRGRCLWMGLHQIQAGTAMALMALCLQVETCSCRPCFDSVSGFVVQDKEWQLLMLLCVCIYVCGACVFKGTA